MACNFGGFACEALLHCLEQLLQRDGFFEKGLGTDANRLDSGVDGGVSTHHDDGHVEHARCGPFFEQAHTIGVRHPDVEQHQIRPCALSRFTRLRCVLGQLHLVAFIKQDFREQIADAQFVVHHQNVCHVVCDWFVVCSRSCPGLRVLQRE